MNISSAFERLLRGRPDELDAYLSTVNSKVEVKSTKALTYCHALLLDGNGRPRVKDLAEFVAARVLDYAIPRSEIVKAQETDIRNNSTAAISKLKKKADGLFTDIKNSGEGGEVLLSILAQAVLRLPQLLCKMPLKTNTKMHYHGVDGIHAKYDEVTETLALYWGESKLHQTPNGAATECFKSISTFLIADGGSSDPKQRDLHLITANIDVLDDKLETALLNYLDKDNPAYNRLEYRAVCLIGFDMDVYPTASKNKKMAEILTEIEEAAQIWNLTVGKSIKAIPTLDRFEIHMFLLPFPSVEAFRLAFLQELGLK
jgi:hypothetical protein